MEGIKLRIQRAATYLNANQAQVDEIRTKIAAIIEQEQYIRADVGQETWQDLIKDLLMQARTALKESTIYNDTVKSALNDIQEMMRI